MNYPMVTVEKQIENAIKWLEALKSGNYKQTKNKLGDKETGFCCWGLGCFIMDIEYSPESGWNDNLHNHIGFISSVGNLTDDPDDDAFSIPLGSYNDYWEFTFPQIANLILDYAYTAFIPQVAEAVLNHFGHASKDT